MKRAMKMLLMVALVAAPFSRTWAAEVMKTEKSALSVDGRMQVLGFGEKVNDPTRNDAQMYLFLKQARLGVSGNYEDYRYKLQLGLGGEDEIKAPSPGVSLGLQDLYVDLPVKFLGKQTFVRVGQHKIPYSRERLEDSGALPFADRSLNNLGFRMGREVGVTGATQVGLLSGAFGVYTGGGRNVPERYLPQVLGSPLVVARLGVNHGYDQDAFATEPGEHKPGVASAFFLNGLYLRDSLVGHSSVLNVRMSERPLLVNPSWNPYLATAPLKQGELYEVGADAAVRVPVGPVAVSGELEANYGSYWHPTGRLNLVGGRAQVGVERGSLDVTARYAVLVPDEKFAMAGKEVTGKRAIQEVTPAVSYRLFGDWARVVADLPILVGVPVANEPNLGVYVLSSQPDQASVLKSGGSVERQNVVQGRLMLQAQF